MLKHPREMQRHPIRDSETLDFYSASARVYLGSGARGVSRHLPSFLDLLPPRARILELGCGGGRDAEAMIAAGFDVDPTDGATEIAQIAEERIRRPVRVMHFDELDALQVYDAVWANASLLHVPRTCLPQILARVFRVLKPDGLHFASYKGGSAEGRDRFGRYFNYLSREEVIEAYRRSGPWQVVSVTEYLGGGYDGNKGPGSPSQCGGRRGYGGPDAGRVDLPTIAAATASACESFDPLGDGFDIRPVMGEARVVSGDMKN
jgi:SAM-dependent methyltransferase